MSINRIYITSLLILLRTSVFSHVNTFSHYFRFGMEYTHNQAALRGFFNKIYYRLGGYYSDTYLRINNEQLSDYGITFGVGLPLKAYKSSFNLGMVLAKEEHLKTI